MWKVLLANQLFLGYSSAAFQLAEWKKKSGMPIFSVNDAKIMNRGDSFTSDEKSEHYGGLFHYQTKQNWSQVNRAPFEYPFFMCSFRINCSMRRQIHMEWANGVQQRRKPIKEIVWHSIYHWLWGGKMGEIGETCLCVLHCGTVKVRFFLISWNKLKAKVKFTVTRLSP